MENQKEIWNNIAPEWAKFKQPGEPTLVFMQNQGGKVLDLGCGSGRYMVKNPNLEYYGIDFSKEMIKLAKEKAKKLNMKAHFEISEVDKIPFEPNFFDSALYDSTLHCIHSKTKRINSLKELFRVLKPGAKLRISVWNKLNRRFRKKEKQDIVNWTDKGPRDYYFYTPEELYEDVESVGFKILKKLEEPGISIPIIVEK